MNIEELRAYCLSKKGVTESFPFNETTLVFKVGGKMFLLADIESNPLQFNVKCNPQRAIELREKYASVFPGYHMNKTNWNTIIADTSLSMKLILSWVDDSYQLVFEGLSKKIRADLDSGKKI